MSRPSCAMGFLSTIRPLSSRSAWARAVPPRTREPLPLRHGAIMENLRLCPNVGQHARTLKDCYHSSAASATNTDTAPPQRPPHIPSPRALSRPALQPNRKEGRRLLETLQRAYQSSDPVAQGLATPAGAVSGAINDKALGAAMALAGNEPYYPFIWLPVPLYSRMLEQADR